MAKKNTKCPACGYRFHKRLVTAKFFLDDCHKCQLLRAKIEKASSDESYYDFFELKKFKAYYEPFRKRVFKKNWKEILAYKSTGKALDIGASMGWFLDVKPSKWTVFGIEKYSASIPSKYKKTIKELDIYDLVKSKSKYDLVTMWNVIEHLRDPNEALQIVNSVLDKEGILALSFPNSSGLMNRFSYLLFDASFGLLKKQLYVLFQIDSASPHLFHYNATNMKLLLEKNGFSILKIGEQPILDASNIEKRIQIEKATIASMVSGLAKLIAFIFVFLSKVFNMQDEVIIYSKKI